MTPNDKDFLVGLSELLENTNLVRELVSPIAQACVKWISDYPETTREIAETIEHSSSAHILWPLWAGIRMHLGDKNLCLPREVREIGRMVQKMIEQQEVKP